MFDMSNCASIEMCFTNDDADYSILRVSWDFKASLMCIIIMSQQPPKCANWA